MMTEAADVCKGLEDAVGSVRVLFECQQVDVALCAVFKDCVHTGGAISSVCDG